MKTIEKHDNNKSLTQVLTTYCNGPLWESICGILNQKNKENQKKISYDENLEIYNLLINGHDGKNLPPIARKVHNDWDNNIDLYPSH